MLKHALLIAGATLMSAALLSTVNAKPTTLTIASSQGAADTFDQKRRCKAGYRYSSSRKRCVRIKRRGSY